MGERTMRSVLAVAVLSAAGTWAASGSSTSAPTDALEATTLVTDDNGDPVGLELCDDVAENATSRPSWRSGSGASRLITRSRSVIIVRLNRP